MERVFVYLQERERERENWPKIPISRKEIFARNCVARICIVEWNMGSIALFSVSRTSLFIIQVEIRLLVGVVYIRCDTHSYYARWIIKRGKIKVKLSRRLILKRSIAILSRRLRIILLRFIIFDYYVIIERVVRVFILRNYIFFSPPFFSLFEKTVLKNYRP